MAATIGQAEGIPEDYPTDDGDFLWHRLEQWVRHRWTPRGVTWVVEGPGEWTPPLTPATVTIVEIWSGGEWTEAFPAPSPLGGFMLQGKGPYRITGTAGADNPAPAPVLEAFDRLKAYAEAEAGGVPGASTYSINIGQMSETIRRNPAFMARALEMSGAADLLRSYRRA